MCKNKILPFTSAVSSDYYNGINQPEAKKMQHRDHEVAG
jgi:hypothetical protein